MPREVEDGGVGSAIRAATNTNQLSEHPVPELVEPERPVRVGQHVPQQVPGLVLWSITGADAPGPTNTGSNGRASSSRPCRRCLGRADQHRQLGHIPGGPDMLNLPSPDALLHDLHRGRAESGRHLPDERAHPSTLKGPPLVPRPEIDHQTSFDKAIHVAERPTCASQARR